MKLAEMKQIGNAVKLTVEKILTYFLYTCLLVATSFSICQPANYGYLKRNEEAMAGM